MSSSTHPETVSPTAYGTGYFWYARGMSHPVFATRQGRAMHYLVRLLSGGYHAVGGMSLDALMLARHRGIDEVLRAAIEQGRVQQVIEVAAGLSPRGWSFKQRYGRQIEYIETDLPHMAELKRKLLTQGGLLSPGHEVLTVDALRDEGPNSLLEIAKSLNAKRGTAIITEGLMNYFDPESAYGMWRRFAKTLRRFPQGLYLADVYAQETKAPAAADAFMKLLSSFVRSRMHIHFDSRAAIEAGIASAGFAEVKAHATRDLQDTRSLSLIKGGDQVYILEAQVGKNTA